MPSPHDRWDWALGGDPLVNAAEPWRYAALAVPAVVLALVGITAFDRRDIRSAERIEE